MRDGFPIGGGSEAELLLRWLGYLRGAVLSSSDGLTDTQARTRPHGRLIPVLGIVRHLTCVEQRWIDGGFQGADVGRSEEEFAPGPEHTVDSVRANYLQRAESTDSFVRGTPLSTPCATEPGTDLRWVLLHLINETARHAGHADATRELLDGRTGE